MLFLDALISIFFSDGTSSDDVPLSVLHPENFCVFTILVTLLTDQNLNELKENQFYYDYLPTTLFEPIPGLSKLKNFNLSKIFLLYNNNIYVPPNCCSSVLNICHDSPSVGHFSIKKTTSHTSRDFWWPSLFSTINNYVHSCDSCCRSKDSRHKLYGFLQPLDTS